MSELLDSEALVPSGPPAAETYMPLGALTIMEAVPATAATMGFEGTTGDNEGGLRKL